MANSCHRQMKEEEGRRNTAMEAFQVAERSLQEMKKKLQEEESERKYAAAALENAERQAESQRLQLWGVEDQLATSRTQIAALKKKLEEVKKARILAEKAKEEAKKAKDEAEQHGYKAGAKASSVLRRAENIYYPPAIHASSSSDSKAVSPSSKAGEVQGGPLKAPLAVDTTTKGLE
nr:uncharacterized protein LOC112024527 [Quercus suber]